MPQQLARYKVPAPRRVRRAAEDLDRQDPEVHAARDGEGAVSRAGSAVAAETNSRREPGARLESAERQEHRGLAGVRHRSRDPFRAELRVGMAWR